MDEGIVTCQDAHRRSSGSHRGSEGKLPVASTFSMIGNRGRRVCLLIAFDQLTVSLTQKVSDLVMEQATLSGRQLGIERITHQDMTKHIGCRQIRTNNVDRLEQMGSNN